MSDLRDATQRPASLLQTMRAVAWSFFGVRRPTDYDRDAAQITIAQAMAGGLIGAVVLIATLLGVVHMVMP